MTDSALADSDPYHLQRFVDAQELVYEQVRKELSGGHKTSHWMWFIFPQLAGLGGSPVAVRYAIESLVEARAYLAHPVLGLRLQECCGLLIGHASQPIADILPWPDDLKLKSSITLFSRATESNQSFIMVIDQFFDGQLDQVTLDRLARRP